MEPEDIRHLGYPAIAKLISHEVGGELANFLRLIGQGK